MANNLRSTGDNKLDLLQANLVNEFSRRLSDTNKRVTILETRQKDFLIFGSILSGIISTGVGLFIKLL